MLAEEMSRLKKISGAHRASVSWHTTHVEGILGQSTNQNTAKLKHLNESLNAKLEVISLLDGNILDLTPEDDLDRKVQLADKTWEKIIQIQAALKDVYKNTTTTRELADQPQQLTSQDHDGSRESTPEHRACHVKLPKLSIKRFGGDLTKWTTFWDAFDAAVHSNPHLSNIEKFNYLNSLLESTAAEAVTGLSLTDANYSAAVAILKKRFGNTQLIVNRHMDALLRLTAVTSHHDVKGLRRLCDAIEANVRGLKALEVDSESYGSLMVSILMNKMPSEIRLIVSRSLKTENWDFNEVMQIMEQKVHARERSFTSTQQTQQPPKNPPPRGTATASNTESATIKCAFCDQDHRSHTCLQVTDVKARKEALQKSGRCYLCLRKGHLIRQCRSSSICGKCSGKHHSSICTRLNQSNTEQRSTSQIPSQQQDSHPTRNTNAMYVNLQTPILLQMARLQLCDPKEPACPPACVEVRAIMDTRSQHT